MLTQTREAFEALLTENERMRRVYNESNTVKILEQRDAAVARSAALEAERDALKAALGDAADALVWCSGSADFAPKARARGGWERGPAVVLHRIFALLGIGGGS